MAMSLEISLEKIDNSRHKQEGSS